MKEIMQSAEFEHMISNLVLDSEQLKYSGDRNKFKSFLKHYEYLNKNFLFEDNSKYEELSENISKLGRLNILSDEVREELEVFINEELFFIVMGIEYDELLNEDEECFEFLSENFTNKSKTGILIYFISKAICLCNELLDDEAELKANQLKSIEGFKEYLKRKFEELSCSKYALLQADCIIRNKEGNKDFARKVKTKLNYEWTGLDFGNKHIGEPNIRELLDEIQKKDISVANRVSEIVGDIDESDIMELYNEIVQDNLREREVFKEFHEL